MTIRVRELAGAIGAEVHGLDLSDPTFDVALLHDLFAQHHALFFPDQDLEAADFCGSCKRSVNHWCIHT